MKAIQKINNNVAVCVDSNGKELIAFGKGIGFPIMPYEIENLGMISMTFYRIDRSFYKLFEEVPEEVFEVSALIAQKAQKTLDCNLNPNMIAGLADHINFAIIRMKKYKELKMLFSYDIEQMYPLETELGRYSVKLIQMRLGISLPNSEVTNIAMHFVNAKEENLNKDLKKDIEAMISHITGLIEQFFHIKINSDGFNYNRFVMHLRYYIKRAEENKQFLDGNANLLEAIKQENPQYYECAALIAKYIDEQLQAQSTDDEVLYLTIHVNRIIKNNILTEDCNS